MSDASSVGREAYRQGEALGFAPGVGMPAGAVRVAAEGVQALPSIAGDIGRVIGGLPSKAAARQFEDFAAYQRSIPPSDVSPLTAYHGTPHTFPAEPESPLGRFRAEKIGTGEGAQAYGYGTYFAESPGTAGYYKDVLSEQNVVATKLNGAPQLNDPEYGSILVLNKTNAPEKTLVGKDAINYLQNYLQRFVMSDGYNKKMANAALDWLEMAKRENWPVELPGKDTTKIKGSLYTVDIPDAMVGKMLDWDKPLSQQPGMVKKVFENGWQHALYRQRSGRNVGDFTGADLVRSFGTDTRSSVMASEQLRQAGIPGIRYLDQTSRADGEGTRNIVVFPGEEKNVKILSRD
jgi:hypothetical protein